MTKPANGIVAEVVVIAAANSRHPAASFEHILGKGRLQSKGRISNCSLKSLDYLSSSASKKIICP